MAEPDPRFIGERLDRIQTELRDLRALKTDVALLTERMGTPRKTRQVVIANPPSG